MQYTKTITRCNFIWITLLMLFLSPASAQVNQHSFQLDGHFDSSIHGTVYLSYYSSTKRIGINQSSEIVNGYFSFKGDLVEPAVAFIRLTESAENMSIIFLEPTKMKISLAANPFKVISLSGSKTNAEVDSLIQRKAELQKIYQPIIDELSSKKDGAISPELESKLERFDNSLEQMDFDFFVTHPSSFATGYLLQSYYPKLSTDSLQMFYDSMDDLLKGSIYGVQLQDEIDAKKQINIKSKAPNFSSKTNIGQIISLSDFYGKYVLLDFWAHWCIPCRQGFPKLLSQFKLYHERGLEIIGIADDDDKPAEWEKAIKNDGIELWYNILRGVKINKDGTADLSKSINNLYNVQDLPTKILIDQSGKIIGKYVGTESDEELEERLKQIFK